MSDLEINNNQNAIHQQQQGSAESNLQKYSLLHSVDEEKLLLQSTKDQNIAQLNDLSRNSSMCDQPIQLSASNLDDANLKIVKETSNLSGVSLKSQSSEQKKIEQKKKKLWVSEDAVDTVKEYTNAFIDLFRWRREYDSFSQLYFQIAFDSVVAYFIKRKVSKLDTQFTQSKKDEQLVKECIRTLNEDPSSFFVKAKLDQNVVVKAKTWGNFVSIIKSDPSKEMKRDIQLNLAQGTIKAILEKDCTLKAKSTPVNTENPMKFLTKIGASVISIFSGVLVKQEATIEENGSSYVDHYFFGKKASLPNGEVGLKISSIFKDFDFQKFKSDQTAFKISILIASGIGLYAAIKLIKNLQYLAKKKKLFKKKN